MNGRWTEHVAGPTTVHGEPAQCCGRCGAAFRLYDFFTPGSSVFHVPGVRGGTFWPVRPGEGAIVPCTPVSVADYPATEGVPER